MAFCKFILIQLCEASTPSWRELAKRAERIADNQVALLAGRWRASGPEQQCVAHGWHDRRSYWMRWKLSRLASSAIRLMLAQAPSTVLPRDRLTIYSVERSTEPLFVAGDVILCVSLLALIAGLLFGCQAQLR